MTCRTPRGLIGPLLASASFLFGFSLPASAEEAGRDLASLALSGRVAEWGRANKDPLALIVAASIRRQIALKTVERVPEGGPSTEPTEGRETTVASLLADAVAAAPKDPTIAALAADVAASRTKGRVDGKAESVATVKGAGVDWYRKLSFEGTRYAEAVVELFGDGRVGISVYDEQGNLVCKDPNPSTVTYCGWHPSATGRFDVKVENLGTRPVRYKIATN